MPETFVDASTDAPGKVVDPMLYASGSTAGKAAKVKADRIARVGKTLDITMPGTLDVVAGGVLTVDGFRPDVDGEWQVKVVKQSISRSGWITEISCESANIDETYRKPKALKEKTQAQTDPDDIEPED